MAAFKVLAALSVQNVFGAYYDYRTRQLQHDELFDNASGFE
jgi:hypothetical protein